MWSYTIHYRGISGVHTTIITQPLWMLLMYQSSEQIPIPRNGLCVPNAGDEVTAVGISELHGGKKVLVRITNAVMPLFKYAPASNGKEVVELIGLANSDSDLCPEGTFAFVTEAEFAQMKRNMQQAASGDKVYVDAEHSTDSLWDRQIANQLHAEELQEP